MLKRFASVCLLLSVGAVLALGGTNDDKMRAKKPFAVRPDDVTAVRTAPARVTAVPYTLGPGDSIGYTHYDYGTNGTPNHNVVNYGDGTFSIGRMASLQGGSFPDRGTYYTYYNKTSWSTWKRVETARRGWGNIGQFVDGGGIEFIVSHVGPILNIDAAKGAGSWTQTVLSSTGSTWPKLAVGTGTNVFTIACDGTPVNLYFHRSTDGGTTWMTEMKIDSTKNGGGVNADGYDIATKGTKVAVAKGGSGTSVVLALSTDNGATFTQSTIYTAKSDSGSINKGEEQQQCDGTIAVAFDNNSNAHVVWGNFLAIGDSLKRPVLYYSLKAGIKHWSQATGVVTQVAYPARDSALLKGNAQMPGVDGAFLTMPQLSFDASGKMFVVYQGQTSEMSKDTLPYSHLYALYSTDGGTKWTVPTDITPVKGSDNAYPSTSINADANLYVVYNTDPWPGNFLQGTTGHPDTTTVVKFLKVAVSTLNSTLQTDVRQVDVTVPSSYNLTQNYPNPFNPNTKISFTLPVSGRTTLKVFNMLGQEVATLVDSHEQAGEYSVDFDASKLASGVYFYRLESGSFTATKKMVLMK